MMIMMVVVVIVGAVAVVLDPMVFTRSSTTVNSFSSLIQRH